MEKHLSWLTDKERELEKKVLAEYSRDEVRRHLEYLTTLSRMAGTEDELKAAKYIKSRLEEYGVGAEIYEIDAYISHPGKAEMEILSPVRTSLPCLPRVFTASTPGDGIEGELISLGNGLEEDYQGVDASGKIVLVKEASIEGRLEASRMADEMRAAAQIYITGGKARTISMGQVRNSWGNPTIATMGQIPKIPSIAICDEDGKYLKELIEKGSILVKMKVDAWRGYKKIRLPIGAVKGTIESEKYVLVGGHYCSWYKGATDNAVASSLMLEMARIFSKYRKSLRRGIRFAWWSGHEQGTYAGSTWYVDNFWEDVRDHAVSYLVMDGLGRIGASGIAPNNTEEIRKFHEHLIKEVLGLEVKSGRVPKIGDQSFWGMGLPSFLVRSITIEQDAARGRTKHVWWSHTSEDTLDKVDMDVITTPFKVNSVSILRLCNNPILPFEFVTVAEAFERRLDELQKGYQLVLDLTSPIAQAKELRKNVETLNKKIKKNLLGFEKRKPDRQIQNKFKEVNACLMELSRILIPILSSKAGKYGQDPMGSKFKAIPTLQALEKLDSMDSNSEEYKAWRTSLLRERNKLSDTLNSANRILDITLKRI